MEETNDSGELKFAGVFLADITIDDSATWIDIAPNPSSFESEVGTINGATWMATTVDTSSFEPQVGVTTECSKTTFFNYFLFFFFLRPT